MKGKQIGRGFLLTNNNNTLLLASSGITRCSSAQAAAFEGLAHVLRHAAAADLWTFFVFLDCFQLSQMQSMKNFQMQNPPFWGLLIDFAFYVLLGIQMLVGSFIQVTSLLPIQLSGQDLWILSIPKLISRVHLLAFLVSLYLCFAPKIKK